MTKSRIYSQEELELVHNVMLSAKTVASHLNVHPATVSRLRNKLNICVPAGTKPGPNMKLRQRVVKACIGKGCNNTFEAGPLNKKKFCSHSCQIKTNPIGSKGRGTRTIRNPNITEYKRYSRLVHALSQETYKNNIDIINPSRYPRTLCGVDGGWQLDHIKPIKECFLEGLSATEAAQVENLRMLPWKNNLMRQYLE